MIKYILKKLFIKICRLLDFEIIDQNQFTSPTLNNSLNENLSKINKKSIVLPLGEVKIKRKINSLNIIFRSNTKVNIWDQNKARIFNKPKSEYTLRSLNSLLNSLQKAKTLLQNINLNLTIVDDNSDKTIIKKINLLLSRWKIVPNIINLNKNEAKMNKKQVMSKIATTMNQSKADAERTFDSILKLILDCLKNDEQVKIAGFGTYKVAKRKARIGRNPRTGEQIQIAASQKVKFLPAKALKEMFNK